jgi:hypothetical protein
MPALVGVPVAESRALSHLAEPPVERVFGVPSAVFVAQYEIGVVPGGATR